jgi:choline dehydrogenase
LELGYRWDDDLNNPDEGELVAAWPINAVGPVRWNAAFAYLDPARARPNLTILPDTLVDRIAIRRGRVAQVEVVNGTRHRRVSSDLVVLAAGTYGSPAILLRSGIGPWAALRTLAIPVVMDLPGVGQNLSDHPGSWLQGLPSRRLEAEFASVDSESLLRTATGLRVMSGTADGRWDLHLICWTEVVPANHGASYELYVSVKLLKPRSRGSVRLRSSDPDVLPIVHHGFLSDASQVDVSRLVDGIRIGRRLIGAAVNSGWLDAEAVPGKAVETDADLAAFVRSNLTGYFHAVGTCRMGLDADPTAVTDGLGRVHGIENLVVADASIMPTIPRANTNWTVAAIAEKIADELISRGA